MSKNKQDAKAITKVSAEQLKGVVGGASAPKAATANPRANVRKKDTGPR